MTTGDAVALYDAARTWARAWDAPPSDAQDENEEEAWKVVMALIDRIADERVLAFARGALLAGGGVDEVGCAYWPSKVVEHIRNTVAQIEMLEKAAADR